MFRTSSCTAASHRETTWQRSESKPVRKNVRTEFSKSNVYANWPIQPKVTTFFAQASAWGEILTCCHVRMYLCLSHSITHARQVGSVWNFGRLMVLFLGGVEIFLTVLGSTCGNAFSCQKLAFRPFLSVISPDRGVGLSWNFARLCGLYDQLLCKCNSRLTRGNYA